MLLEVAEPWEGFITELAGVGGGLGDADGEGELGVGHVGGGVGGGAGARRRGLPLGPPRGARLGPQGVWNKEGGMRPREPPEAGTLQRAA